MQLLMFFKFLIISGGGWMCDFFCYMGAVKVINFSPFLANMISSYVGVTFVWFVSLKAVFGQTYNAKGNYLMFYWVYQFLSILIYSKILHLIVLYFVPKLNGLEGGFGSGFEAVEAKVIVTPFNLMTNFIFMKFLIFFMRREMEGR
jgi:putative flippase GtrA